MQTHAALLVYEIEDALKCSPLPPQKYASFERSTRQVPSNLNRALWKLARLRRLAESIDAAYDKDGRQHQELDTMTKQLHAEMRHSLEIVSALAISLVKVELAHDELSTDRLLADLNTAIMPARAIGGYLEVKEAVQYSSNHSCTRYCRCRPHSILFDDFSHYENSCYRT
jgi:hypothetical protein